MSNSKVNFRDVSCSSIHIPSAWKALNKAVRSIETQTPESFYEFGETESQTGIAAQIIQSQIQRKDAGKTLIEYYSTSHKYLSAEGWRKMIELGKVTVDCEVCTDAQVKLQEDFFVECVSTHCDAEIQTSNIESSTVNIPDNAPGLLGFLQKVLPIMERELEESIESRAFDSYQFTELDASNEIVFWKLLTVDLERHKVVFPDWTTGQYSRGKIVRCLLTRNKERIYDIDFDDQFKLTSVREEHIRLLVQQSKAASAIGSSGVKGSRSGDKKPPSRLLQEGVRVHAKVSSKSETKYLPGRIAKLNRNGTFDVECEGNRMESGLLAEDLIVGLEEGNVVEARRPNKIQLQCTDLSWNATGNSISASFGRNDFSGWCEYPGAVCVWTLFGKDFSPAVPTFVLDHSCCLLCVKFHPTNPAIVAGGSFNGEVVVWDLTTPELPIGISEISDYSHREPVTGLNWIKLESGSNEDWVLASIGGDGKVLVWGFSNAFRFPIRGGTILASSRGKSTKKHYPISHGACSLSISGSSNMGGYSKSSSHGISRWIIIGQEGGGIVRSPLSRLLNNPPCNPDLIKGAPSTEDVFPSIKRSDDGWVHDPHVGPVLSIDSSGFHKNLFLTGGSDGTVKLFHVMEKVPLRQWEPVPPSGTQGISSSFAKITCVKFSPVRPMVFAAGSADGFLYLFDLCESMVSPVAILEALSSPIQPITGSVDQPNSNVDGRSFHQIQNGLVRRVGISSITFNHKQRDLLAACDLFGRVHLWQIPWHLANRNQFELSKLEEIGRRISEL